MKRFPLNKARSSNSPSSPDHASADGKKTLCGANIISLQGQYTRRGEIDCGRCWKAAEGFLEEKKEKRT